VGCEDLACAVDEDGARAAGADVYAEEHGAGLLKRAMCGKETSVEAANFNVANI
jgi:hypothetical protein